MIDQPPAPTAPDDAPNVDDLEIRDELHHERHPWRVTSTGAAEWAMRKLADAAAEAAQVEELHAELTARYDAWRDEQLDRLNRRRAYFDTLLQIYALELREATGGKTKSVKLPSGKITTTHTSASVELVDKAATIAWAKENLEPDEVARIIREDILVSQLADIVAIDEVVEGYRATMSCGEIIDPWPIVEGWRVPLAGETVICPGCETEQQIIELTADTHLEVRDGLGRPVAGTGVRPAKTTASVRPT